MAREEVCRHKGGDSSNAWVHNGVEHFEETGRENRDGAYTAQVFKIVNGLCYSAGRVRIEPDGFITSWSAANRAMRAAIKRHNEVVKAFRAGAMFVVC